MMKKKQFNRIIHWSFTIFLLFYILTGFGITHFQLITPLTAGFLSKPLAFQLHTSLIYPLIILLILHLVLTNKIIWKKWRTYHESRR